jgi:hypothetical protein
MARMWKAVRLTLALLLFVPGFALLGAFGGADNGERTAWSGLAVGALVGVFFGLALGDGLSREWTDAIFGPEQKKRKVEIGHSMLLLDGPRAGRP